MLKFAVIGVLVAGAGAIGYFGERYMRPVAAPPPKATAAKKSEMLFKLPLGKFTMQILQPRRTIHLVFDIDVYVMGSKAFEEINGAVGRAKLRDATVAAIAELAETDQRLSQPTDDEAMRTELAAQLVRKLYVHFPMIRTARINSFHFDKSLRD